MGKLYILGICGSLRAGSFNRLALSLAGELMPENMVLEVEEWREFPIYDEDTQASGIPPAVQTFADRVRHSDAVLFAIPEYNFSLPGGLKNAIDWVSRIDSQPFAEKPVALLSASAGPLGGARVQYDLRRVMMSLNAMVMGRPEVFIGSAQTKFDLGGCCTDNATREFVAAQMVAFERWIRHVKAGQR
jgi:chromate reductase